MEIQGLKLHVLWAQTLQVMPSHTRPLPLQYIKISLPMTKTRATKMPTQSPIIRPSWLLSLGSVDSCK